MHDFLAEPQTAAFWLGLLEIIGINIVLSGDNAVVIALAARQLPTARRRMAVVAGAGGAVALRVVLTAFATNLLQLAWVKTVGGLLLLWIAVKLLLPDAQENDGPAASDNFWQAVRIILVADLVMSLDNVIGIAAAAHGSITLLVLGLAVSVPLIMFSSTLILVWMERMPWIVTAGGALLGWVGGTTIAADPAWVAAVGGREWLETLAGWAGVALVFGGARWVRLRRMIRPSRAA
ncbi:MAG: TerC family protein [Rhodocyclaceae bacterium]|nr:TerC family protein [Rhodocyclaceae bacterium]